MADLLAMYNVALRAVANGVEVQNENENSAAANACRRMYPTARDQVLGDFPWPFATITAALGLVATRPNPNWLYSYRYPADCVKAQAIASVTWMTRNPGSGQIIPYAIGADTEGSLIYCDLVNASLTYTQRITEPGRFSSSLARAVAFQLAYLIAPSVTGGDPSRLGDRAYQLYLSAVSQAQADALNETQPDPQPDAEWISDRV